MTQRRIFGIVRKAMRSMVQWRIFGIVPEVKL
jgi:hypothetical protein